MALEDTVAAGRRLDLGSLLCLIGRHGPAVLLAAAGIAALLAALLIYRSLRGRRWWRRGAAVSPGTEPGEPECEAEVQPSPPEDELQSGEPTDAQSDEVPPEVTEEIDGIESNLKVRQRRRRRRQVAAAPEEKKPPPPPPSSPPPPTPAPVQQLPEEAGVEPEEPENPPQELGKVLAADRQEDVTADQDVTETKVQCPANKQAPQRDQAATVEEQSEQPSKESSEEPSDRPSEEPSEEPDHQLGAVPPPTVTSNLAERLDKEDLESVAPRGDVHVSAKEDKEEDRQRLMEKQEEEEKKEKKEEEKEVQEDAPPMENLPPVIPTTRDDVQEEDQGLALKENHDEAPAEGFWPQTSRMDVQNQDCNPPFELVAEELLTSYVVVDSDSPVQISGADKCPDWSPASDHTEAPSPAPLAPSAPPAPPLDGGGHFTTLKPETLPYCESEDQSSWTGEPSETPDRLVLVSDVLDTKSEASDLRPAVAGSGGMEKKEEEDQEEEKEEAKVEAASAEGEPHPEMFPSVQEPEGHDQEEELLPDSAQVEELLPDSTQEEELLPDSAQEEELLPDSAQEEELLPDSAREEELLPDSAQEEELLPDSAQEEELLPDSAQEEELLPDSAQEEELLPDSAQEEELLPDSTQEEELLSDTAQEEEELLPDSAHKEELPPDFIHEVQLLTNSAQKEELLPDSAQEEELLPDSTQEVELLPDSTKKEELLTNSTQGEELLSDFAQEEVELHPDSAQKEELPTDATQEEELLPDSKQEEKLPPNSAEEEEDLLHDSAQKKELLCDSTQAEELPPDSAQEEVELPPDCVKDDITPPVTAVSWWSSEGRDPAPGDWILIPEFAAAANEDTFGHQVESEYQRLMDHFVAQVEESLKFAVEVIEGEGGEEEEEVEKKNGGAGLEEEGKEEEKKKVEKKMKAGEEEEEQEEQERRRTEISIMEATMDANEWVTDLGQQLLPWLSISAPELPVESSASCGGGGPTPRVAAVPPLLPQTVEVTFRVHYLTWSEQQTLAVTGSRPELGGWTAFVPLEREGKDGEKGEEPGEGRGLWSGRVHLPAHSRLEWKFAVLDKGRVSRWEECRNRVLDTGDQDQLVHGWWGRE